MTEKPMAEDSCSLTMKWYYNTYSQLLSALPVRTCNNIVKGNYKDKRFKNKQATFFQFLDEPLFRSTALENHESR